MLSHYTIYTMPNCPHCVSAKALFDREGLQYTEVKQFTREELTERVGPVRTLPQIIIKQGAEEFHIGGFTDLQAFRAGKMTDLRKLA